MKYYCSDLPDILLPSRPEIIYRILSQPALAVLYRSAHREEDLESKDIHADTSPID